ncbi:ankyrin repeat domain-containing protein 26-like [Trichosurus vulpecula]|uniref:ankyrin repeat domain-containing protein 26-like n=1 Tax=Trichosurus vulpecula TaxID=9337 RepID=UPI00186B0413|nr:ankyrin repeat domain-containing protein 26-like [Trichosurus vulpecula]
MKKIFRFRSSRELSPSRASFPPRRDSGVRPFGPNAGYLIRVKDLGKIHKAASIGDVAKVQQLLMLGKCGVNDVDKENRTSLHLACANGFPDVVSLLVERKCELNLCDNDCQTPLIKAVQCQQEECATILLEHGADPSLMDTNHNTALHYAASGQNITIAANLLRHKVDMEAKNKEGYTPLLFAIKESNQDMVEFFLKNGANVNTSDRLKRTALMLAVSGKSTDIIRLLLQYNIDLSCQDILGWTAEEYAIYNALSLHHQLINQYGTQKTFNQPISPQISGLERVSDPEFTLGGPAKDQKDIEIQESPAQTSGTRISGKVEETSPEESLSRLSNKPGADDSWPITDEEELDFSIKTIHVNYQKDEGIESSQEEERLGDYEDELAEEEENEEEEEEFSHTSDALEGWKDEDTQDEEESQDEEDFENMKEKEGLNISEESTESEEEEKEDGMLIDSGTRDKHLLKLYIFPVNFRLRYIREVCCYKRYDASIRIRRERRCRIFVGFRDASDWDSTSTSAKNESHRSSKDLNFHGDYPCQSLPVTKDQSGSTDFGRIPSKEDAAAGAGSGPETGFRVVILGEKPAPEKECEPQLSLKKEEGKEGLLNFDTTAIVLFELFVKENTEQMFNSSKQDYASDWDSTSTSAKNESHRSSKHLNFHGDYSCQSLPVTEDQSGSTDFERIPSKEDAAAGAGSGPENGFRVVILEEKPAPQKQCELQLSLKREEGKEGTEEADASHWDSTSTSVKNESHRSSKHLNFHGDYPCQSLLVTKDQSGSTDFGRSPSKETEAAGAGSGPETGFRVVILGEKPAPEEQCELQLSLKREEGKEGTEEAGSSEESQESFDKSDLEQDKVQMDADDVDDLTQLSDTAIEDYDLPPLNCKNILLLIEQLSVHCKDPISLLKIEDAVLRYDRSIELKKGHCTLLTRKVKSLQNKITGLQEKLSETREMKFQLELQKVEWDIEFHSLRFTLKQEEEKRVTAEMLFQKIREQLRRKEEQCSKEVDLKQQLEFTLRTLDLELRTAKNNLKQVEEERNDTQRQLSQELSARALQARIWKQNEIEVTASKMIQTSEVSDSNEKEKYLLNKNQTLQNEVAMLKLELDTVKIKDQEKENQYTEENEVLKEKFDELQKELKLNEEALTKTIFQYNGQVNVLTTENAVLNSKLENEKQNRDRLETEIESYRSHLTSAIRDHERSQTSKLDLEQTFQREQDEWLRLQDKLNHEFSSLRESNSVLSQELSKAESKANSLENELYHVRDSLREKTLILESTRRELNQAQSEAKELEHTNQVEKEKLNEYIIKQESSEERVAQIQSENMLLRQQLEGAQSKGIIKEKVLSDTQVQFIDLFNKVRADTEKQALMVKERNKELISECNHLREQMCKYENEKAEGEATVRKLQELAVSLKKQSMTEASVEITSLYRNDLEDKKKLQEEIDQTKSKLNTEREKLKKLIELKQFLENHLEQERTRNDELQKDLNGFKKLLKITKKKLREYEKGDVVYQGRVKQTHSEMDRQINRLKNEIEDLTQQLEAASSNCKQLESINQSLREKLFSVKILQKKCDKLERNKRQLEEEVVNLKHNLEITKLERSQIEQYKCEIDERARQEIVEKLKEVNLFLQTQAAARDNLEQLRENSNASIRNLMEQQIRDLEFELYRMKKSHQDSAEAELERYRQLYSEELKVRKSLSDKLDSTNERLAEVSHQLLNEREKNNILINSCTANSILEPAHIGNINISMLLSRSLIPRGNLVYSIGNRASSRSRVEDYLTQMRQELQESITRELNEDKLESRT